MLKIPALSCLIMLIFFASVPADSMETLINHDCARCHSLKPEEAVLILKPLGLNVKNVKHAPIKGMFEVLAERDGAEGIIYVDYGRKLLMQGVIVDAGTRWTEDK